VVVTGGCGFIGSNLVHFLLERHPDWQVVNVDALTYAANPHNLQELENNPRYRFVHLDVSDRDGVRAMLEEVGPQGVFHLAADTHVDNSIRDAEPFIRNNIIGTWVLLEETKRLWGDDRSRRFLHVSTDEVYGTLGPNDPAFNEHTPYAPTNPYSASKAASDHLVRAWHHTHGMNVVTTHCSNNFGPRQHSEKLIPTVIRTALAGRPIPVYGQGLNVRDWLYVGDHCSAINAVFERGTAGETYAIGTRNEWRNIDLVRAICAVLDEEVEGGPKGGHASLITYVTDRPGHDLRYSIDPTRIETELGWHAEAGFDEGLRRTVQWYVQEGQRAAV